MKDLKTKVLIVGGGPAGTSTGLALLNDNIDCIIVDKRSFPREKLCGGLITQIGVDELERLGIDVNDEIFFKPKKVRFYDDSKEIFEYESSARYAVVERMIFDNFLVSEFKTRGGKMIENEIITKIDTVGKFVETKSGTIIRYEYLVGADGANSVVRKEINNKNMKLAFCSEYTLGKEKFKKYKYDGINVLFNKIDVGFAWVFENSNNSTVGVGGLIEPPKVINILKNIESSDCTVTGAFVPYGELAEIRATDNVFLVGDAGGYVDPILGEGISYALMSGRKISNVLNSENKSEKYYKEFMEIEKMVLAGSKLQKIFFNKRFNRFVLENFQKHPNLTKRLCENLVMCGSVKYNEISKILKVVINGK